MMKLSFYWSRVEKNKYLWIKITIFVPIYKKNTSYISEVASQSSANLRHLLASDAQATTCLNYRHRHGCAQWPTTESPLSEMKIISSNKWGSKLISKFSPILPEAIVSNSRTKIMILHRKTEKYAGFDYCYKR